MNTLFHPAEKPMLLIVDDEPINLRDLKENLESLYRIRPVPSGVRALEFLSVTSPDLILLDLQMPVMDGAEVIRRIKGNPAWENIPVIFLTGTEDGTAEQRCLALGAVDYIVRPCSIDVVKARVASHLELAFYRKGLERTVEERTFQLKQTQEAILNILANMTAFRDNETGAHIQRTTLYTEAIINTLREKHVPGYEVDEQYAESTIKSAKLHDIGKVAVSDNILFKPSRLTPEEFATIKQHPVFGATILDNAMSEIGDTSYFLTVAREIIIGHHEKWDGSGYPTGLSGDAIPLSARIMAIADVYDALVSARPYKKPFTHEESMDIIRRDSGSHFDPHLIELCADTMNTIFPEIAAKEFAD